MLSRAVTNIARVLLGDDNLTTWSDAVLLQYLNDAVLAILQVRPDANAVIEDMTLATGTKQSLPTGGLRLLDVIRNTGGASIRRTVRSTLDTLSPNWGQSTAAAVKEFVFDERIPKQFYVNPGAATTFQIEICYSKLPTLVADLDADNFPLDDIYSSAAAEWILYRCWSGDSENTPNYQRANAKHKAFFDLLGVKTQADIAVNPS